MDIEEVFDTIIALPGLNYIKGYEEGFKQGEFD